MIRFDEHYAWLSGLTVLSPLTDRELVQLDTDRARRLAAQDGVESEPEHHQ